MIIIASNIFRSGKIGTHTLYKGTQNLTRARPGVWATFARPGGGGHICAPPANSKTTQRIDKRKKALDRS